MDSGLLEGEVVLLPCRFCASVSIRLDVRPGSAVKPCPKCGEFTSFRIERGTAGLEVSSRSVVREPRRNAARR